MSRYTPTELKAMKISQALAEKNKKVQAFNKPVAQVSKVQRPLAQPSVPPQVISKPSLPASKYQAVSKPVLSQPSISRPVSLKKSPIDRLIALKNAKLLEASKITPASLIPPPAPVPKAQSEAPRSELHVPPQAPVPKNTVQHVPAKAHTKDSLLEEQNYKGPIALAKFRRLRKQRSVGRPLVQIPQPVQSSPAVHHVDISNPPPAAQHGK